MNSLASIAHHNTQIFWDMAKQLDPEFFLLRRTLQETKINPMILPKFLRSVFNVAVGTGYGKITLYMENGKVTMIEGTEKDRVEANALLENPFEKMI